MSGITMSKKSQLSSRCAPITRGYPRATAPLRNSSRPTLFLISVSLRRRGFRRVSCQTAPYKLDENILQSWFVLLQGQDPPVMRGQCANDRTDGRFVFKYELQVMGYTAFIGCCDYANHARRGFQCCNGLFRNTRSTYVEGWLLLQQVLQVRGRIARQHFTVVDYSDAVA